LVASAAPPGSSRQNAIFDVTDPLAATLQRTLGDDYRIERELGGGGMSRVFVAHDLSLDRDIVIKVLSGEATAGVSADRFRREIQLIARMQHPHVVSILSAGAADGSLFYTMPYVAGETLRARIAREGALPVADAVRLLREVLDALAFAHDHGVVHRDIKPENVLVSASHAVVADFGIAKALTDSGTLTSAGFALGTPTYMAPEQATADPSTDHRADLYSVGVLGYELLTGAPPFTGSPQQVITQHLTVAPVPIATRRADVPESLAAVIERALMKEPAARPGSAREMIAALDAMTTPAPAPARTTSHRTFSRRRLTLVAAGVVALVAAGTDAVRTSATSASTPPVSPVASGADLIAVMPLSAVSDTSLARLGQDLVVTLSTNLDGVGSLHTVDAATLLMRARKLPSPLPLAEARAAARDLGARSVLTGTLINEGDRVRASVTLHRVGSDSAIARATALAAPHDIATLTDSLTWSVLQQVWQRGTPPSPLLAGLTTRSVDALRAFLDGEREFQRLAVDAALADFRRAFELDSNFVQALLRYDAVNGWRVAPPDTQVLRRLMALKDRLPERERLHLEMSQRRLPFLQRLDAWKALLARYPDYPPVLMAAADPIVHSGPYYGIPIAEARPTLDRLEELVPEHADTRFHQALMSLEIGSADSIAVTTAAAARVMGPPWGPVLDLASRLHAARASGRPFPPPEAAFPAARALAAASRSRTPYYAVLGMLGVDAHFAAYKLEALERVRAAGIYTGDVDLHSSLGEGILYLSRGDWAHGLRALRRIEGASLPIADRMSGARLACIGAWLGVVNAATADSALRRVRALRGSDAVLLDRVELLWLDGLLGMVTADAARVQGARRALLADTSAAARRSARSLDGLWLERTDRDAAADTLRAVTEAAMREGNFPMSIEAVDRLIVARALRRRGSPADAERYLMWPDAQTNSVRNFAVKFALAPLVSYERGLALEEAGNRRAAEFQLQRFVDAYDQPLPSQRDLVSDATRRLAALRKTDAPPAR
jgi:serine/threonine protein kinase